MPAAEPPVQEAPKLVLHPVSDQARGDLYRQYADLHERFLGGEMESTRQKDIIHPQDSDILKSQLKELEAKLIAPSVEDNEGFSDLIGTSKAGIFRLFPRGGRCDNKYNFSVRGNACYYTFLTENHAYGFGSDIEYCAAGEESEGDFSVGFAGVDYGFFAKLGDIDIRSITPSDPLVQAAIDYRPPDDLPESAWREEKRRFRVARVGPDQVPDASTRSKGIDDFSDRVPAKIGASYAVRSINERKYDVLAVFQVIRADSLDGSLIIAYRVLSESPPSCVQREKPKGRGWDSFDGFGG